jgi:hypothetical protein
MPLCRERSPGRIPEMNAQQIIDSIEADIERIRNLDAALLASLVSRLDELRRLQCRQ